MAGTAALTPELTFATWEDHGFAQHGYWLGDDPAGPRSPAEMHVPAAAEPVTWAGYCTGATGAALVEMLTADGAILAVVPQGRPFWFAHAPAPPGPPCGPRCTVTGTRTHAHARPRPRRTP